MLHGYKNVKEKYLTYLGAKLADLSTGQKVYWKILNKVLSKCKIPRIPHPCLCRINILPIVKKELRIQSLSFLPSAFHYSELPALRFRTNSRIS